MSMLGRCKNCAWSRIHEQLGGFGTYCHANPPVLHFIPMPGGRGTNMHGLWPPVDPETGWCMTHVMAPEAERTKEPAGQAILPPSIDISGRKPS